MVQAAAYKIILDKQVAQYKLHSKCIIAAAGNRSTDNAVVFDMSTALSSRLVHYELETDAKSWLDWAMNNNIHTTILAFISYSTTSLNDFTNESDQEDTYACPRTWSFLSKILHNYEKINGKHSVENATNNSGFLATINGTIGKIAIKFATFLEIYKSLVSVQEILESPLTAALPEKRIEQFALIFELASVITPDNENIICQYLERKDFPVVLGDEIKLQFLRCVKAHNPNIIMEFDKYPSLDSMLSIINNNVTDEVKY
jgi:hypothetical protein